MSMLHTKSFEVSSPDVKYRLESPAVSAAAARLSRRADCVARARVCSEDYIESTYQYHSTECVEKDGHVVRGPEKNNSARTAAVGY